MQSFQSAVHFVLRGLLLELPYKVLWLDLPRNNSNYITLGISVGPNVNLVYKISYLKKIQDYMYFRTKGRSPTKSL